MAFCHNTAGFPNGAIESGPLPNLTFHASASGLQDPGVHVHSGLGHQLVSHEVGVMRRGDEVVTQRASHVLVDLVVFRVEDVPSRAAHVRGEPCKERKIQGSGYSRRALGWGVGGRPSLTPRWNY